MYLSRACFVLPLLSTCYSWGDALMEDDSDLSDRYIVTLRPHAQLYSHVSWAQSVLAASASSNTRATSYGGVLFVYEIASYKAYAIHFDPSAIRAIQTHPEVESVQKDQRWTTNVLTVQHDATYGLNLISHRKLGREPEGYKYDSLAGSGSFAYVLDTGIDIAHPEFEGRAFFGFNAVKNSNSDWDHVGHGTHVAGIIGSKRYGVAKKCELISVKVLGDNHGPMSEVLAGFDWAVNHILARKRMRKSVINLSLGGPLDVSFNKAIDSAYELGVITVVSAGNDNRNCNSSSPASAAGAIAVGATDQIRTRAVWSNWGPKIALFAPGTHVESLWPRGRPKTDVSLSGTSMAAPFVSGVVAYMQSMRSFRTPHSLKKSLLSLATEGVVDEAMDSPNLFLYNGGGSRLV